MQSQVFPLETQHFRCVDSNDTEASERARNENRIIWIWDILGIAEMEIRR